MKKIPTLYLRDDADRARLIPTVHPDCAWVLAGEGIPTIKWDGTACMIRDGRLYKRLDLKPGRTLPAHFEPCGEPDPVTRHHPGWVPVTEGPQDKWLREALRHVAGTLPDGTYELIGPKVQGNPHHLRSLTLIPHGATPLAPADIPLDYEGLRRFLATFGSEGIVWHHPDGRRAKIKRRDFGLPWPLPETSL